MKIKYFYLTAAAIIMIFALSSCHSDGYMIAGKIDTDNLEGRKIVLLTENSDFSDSTVIKNNSFTFRGKTDRILNAAISFEDKIVRFYLVNDKIVIDINNENSDKSSVRYKKSKVTEHINKHFFVSGIPDNLLLSQDGKILRKKANLADILAIFEAR
jgi:hypothetical protein